MAETSAAARIGQVISDRYRVQELLGEGGMGAVYLAEHTLMRKRVALKLLHPELSEDEEILARFKREAEAAAHIEHPNVASATDFGKTADGAFFLVLEYVEGTSLRQVLKGGALSPARSLHIARQIANALERAHGAGIVHRDLKPENVMLVKKGDDPDFVKVLDFGIARFDASHRSASTAQPLTRHGTILGTPEYMAPEQGVGDVAGPTADLYSLGIMLYEMLTGRHPFDAEGAEMMSMHILSPIPAMSERAPNVRVDPAIEAVVKSLLVKEPTERVPSARALIEAIESVAHACGIDLGGGGTSAPIARNAGPDVDAFAKTSIGTPAAPNVALPPKTEAKKTALPPAVLIGGAIGAVVLVAIVVIAIALGSHSAKTHAADGGSLVASATATEADPGTKQAPKSKTAGAAKIEAARTPEALEALVKEYPKDPQVRRALAIALEEKGRVAESLQTIRAMLSSCDEPLSAVDAELTGVVVGATGLPSTSDEAFALLEGPLGARGVDALIDIAQMKSSPALARRATRSLSAPHVRMKASPAAAVLLDMKAAKNCQAKKELLERAKSEGDARMLGVLGPMKEPRGCGFMGMRDCWPCLRKDSALDDAIAAIEARKTK